MIHRSQIVSLLIELHAGRVVVSPDPTAATGRETGKDEAQTHTPTVGLRPQEKLAGDTVVRRGHFALRTRRPAGRIRRGETGGGRTVACATPDNNPSRNTSQNPSQNPSQADQTTPQAVVTRT